MAKKILFFLIIILIIGGGVGGYLYFSNKKTGQEQKIEVVNINPLDYLVFEIKKENYSEFQKEKAFNQFNSGKNNIEQAVKNSVELGSNNLYYDWLNITGAMHMIGDYEREAQILKWFTGVYPGNSVSPSNLGNLYKSFIVNNQESEKYYLIALEREKKKYDIYYGLYELYRYNFKDLKKALEILEHGRKNNPDEKSYVVDIVDYLVVLDRKDEAEKIIDEWLVNHPEDFSLKERLQ